MPFVEVDGASIRYEVSGSGRPLLLLSGFAGTAESWDLFESFFPGCSLIRFDYRLTGRSIAADGEIAPSLSAGDAAAVLESVGAGPAGVFGVSAGGMVALELSLARPELVTALALGCTTAGGAPWLERLRTSRPLWDLLVGSVMLAEDASAACDLLLPVLVPADRVTPELKSLVLADLQSRRDPLAAPWALLRHVQGQMRHGYDVRDRLGSLGMPTLVQHGTGDLLVPFEEGAFIAGAVPGATLRSFPGAGHVYWLDDPAAAFGEVIELTRTVS